jgi:predicted TIM-barrel fold metal-dependent hydrolase
MLSRRDFLSAGLAGVAATMTRPLWAQPSPTPVIDMHVHLIRRMSKPPLEPKVFHDNPLVSHWTWHEFNGDLYVQEMRVAGVDKALLKTFNREDVAQALKQEFDAQPSDFDTSESWMLQYRDKYPDKFIWSATVNPTIKNFRQEWTAKFGRGLRAIVLFPGLQDHRLDHPDVTWLLDECEKRGLRSVMMSFENVTRKNTAADYNKQLYAMIDAHPKLRFDFLHTGYQVPHMLDREPTLELINHFNRKSGNVWAQSDNYYLDSRYPFPKHLAGTKDLFDHIGSDRVMWGTDWPWIENVAKYYQTLQSVRENCTYMSKEQVAKFTGGNAVEFLGLTATSSF